MGLILPPGGGVVIDPGQTTVYAPPDGAARRTGTAKSYTYDDTGAYSGSTNIEVPSYGSFSVVFDKAAKTIVAAAGMGVFLDTDTIVIKGSVSNADLVVTVNGNSSATTTTVNETTLTDEAGGAAVFVTICKRAPMPNAASYDNNVVIMGAKRQWLANTSSGLRVGAASGGLLVWYDAAQAYTIYSSANTIQCVSSSLMRIIGGAGLVGNFHVGHCYQFLGFATAMNNLTGGWECTVVAVNGADLDLTFKTYTYAYFTAEAAVGDSIKVVCNSIFAHCAACNAALVSGKADWVVPNIFEALSIMDFEAPTGVPDPTAFPSFPITDYLWTATARPGFVTSKYRIIYDGNASFAQWSATTVQWAFLKRGP